MHKFVSYLAEVLHINAMKKNTLLTLASVVGTVFSVLLISAWVVLTGLFIHYQVQPSVYDGVQVDVKNQTFLYHKTVKSEVKSTSGPGTIKIERSIGLNPGESEHGKGGEKIPVGDVHLFTLYFLYGQLAASLVLLYFITKEVVKVIKSVQQLNTFRTGNVQSFRRIGFMCLMLSAVQWFSLFSAEGHSTYKFSVELTPLVFMLAAFVLAEIFKEGNQLFEQEKLTI